MNHATGIAAPTRHEKRFVFICGPVGCGNSFLFRCLTEDTGNYGIDEGDLGGTLLRLTGSKRNIERCAHAREAFAEFMHALAGDRTAFIEKTPSNIRHQSSLRAALPHTIHFLYTVREPHAALASGLSSGRTLVHDVEHVARLWREDCELIAPSGAGDLTVVYDDFVCEPKPTLDRISENVLPLSEDVYRFADRMARPDRSDDERWRNRVDAVTAERIEFWIRELGLDAIFESVRHPDTPFGYTPQAARRRNSAWQRTRAQLFNLYYRRRSASRL